jgi:alanine-glyoxylate transaminase/serine-glyoxylate transaminase/serine-pyruvate transaminase
VSESTVVKPSLAAGPEIVAIPGPTVVPARVLSAMHRAMPDIYDGELLAVTDEVFDALPGLAGTSSRGFVTISNGHGAWEMALTNTLSRGDRVLALNCGRFGAVWAEMANFDGLDVEMLEAAPGRANDPARLEERLRLDSSHDIKAVLMVHADTASSARNDVPAFRQAMDAVGHPALLMVDCIATMGCERFLMDEWGVDLALAASQKGLMTPPGLGFVWPGPRALAAHATADLRTRYWDWTYRTEQGPHYLRYCGTPPVAHLFGIREALRMIEEEGLEARWARHLALADAVRAAVEAWSAPGGLSLNVIEASERANSVTTIRTGSIDAVELSRICKDELGVTLGVGVGDVAGSSFRIGHMGHVNAPMVLGVLGSVEAALMSMEAPIGGSGVAAAAVSLSGALAGGG